jgi:hypothetical protein
MSMMSLMSLMMDDAKKQTVRWYTEERISRRKRGERRRKNAQKREYPEERGVKDEEKMAWP